MKTIKDYSLYLVITEEYGRLRNSVKIAEAAIVGGVDIIQMREKNKPRGELITLGRKLSCLCKDRGATFIVNDDPILAKEVDADGVHLGQKDAVKYPLEEARKILDRDKIVGVSTHSIEQFTWANDEGFDYMAFGPIFKTKTKDYFLGTGDIKKVVKIAKKPTFFIGGINLSNIDDVLKEGAKNIALIRGITESQAVAKTTREFKDRILGRVEKDITLKVNGQIESVKESTMLTVLLADKGIIPERVVIEHNLRVVPRQEWRALALKENDVIEIISFMGGGCDE